MPLLLAAVAVDGPGGAQAAWRDLISALELAAMLLVAALLVHAGGGGLSLLTGCLCCRGAAGSVPSVKLIHLQSAPVSPRAASCACALLLLLGPRQPNNEPLWCRAPVAVQ